jgi:hypothetical protein
VSARKIIQNGDLVTVLQQKTHRGATNVICASSNQNVFRHLLHRKKRSFLGGRCSGPIRTYFYDAANAGFPSLRLQFCNNERLIRPLLSFQKSKQIAVVI